MLLSIVTINYNNKQGLEKTLKSVNAQSFQEFEHIIVDGGSNDRSVELIRQYADESSYMVRWVSEHDEGIYNAMNKGVRMASGDYIQILNSGDCLYSDDVVEMMLETLEQSGYPGIMYGNMIRDIPNHKHKRDRCCGQQDWTMYDFICGTINHDPTYIRRDIYEKYGLYREDLPITADWRWFVEAVAFGGEKPVYVDIDVTLFDVNGISETQIERREMERDEELKRILPMCVYKDYRRWHFAIDQVKRLERHRWAYGLFYLLERTLFKLEKWHML